MTKRKTNKPSTTDRVLRAGEYMKLNAESNIRYCGAQQFHKDKEAADKYFEIEIEPNTREFDGDYASRIYTLIEEGYYEEAPFKDYLPDELNHFREYADSFDFEFLTMMSVMKFYDVYCLKSNDNSTYLEDFRDRVICNAIISADGNPRRVLDTIEACMTRVFQPATPTFLNACKAQRGEFTSCFLLRIEDNMESIAKAVTHSLQLSKRGGGVALNATNLRARGSSIKGREGVASGIIPVAKLLEDSFNYANQLGARAGSGALYLSIMHRDILEVLDSKKENADESIRLKRLSIGVVVPDIAFELAKRNEDMILFDPLEIYQATGKQMTEISLTEEYYNLLANPKISKTHKVSARKLFQQMAEIAFESGYPYLVFEDTVNKNNPQPHVSRISMSNLCSEILQPQEPSYFDQKGEFAEVGVDIACNLGSLDLDALVRSEDNFGNFVQSAIFALDAISRKTSLESVPSVQRGNDRNHALGLGTMNLHGALATHEIFYDSEEALDFTNIVHYCIAYNAYKASVSLAKVYGRYADFKGSRHEDGSFFEKYTNPEIPFVPVTAKCEEIFKDIYVPTPEDWEALVKEIQVFGLANSFVMAVAPTGSISYLSGCTPSLQPVSNAVEIRKDGRLGRIYIPAYKMTEENMQYYIEDAYDIPSKALIDIYAEASQHVDQGVSLTLFETNQATTKDINKIYIDAWRTGKIKTIYYLRVRQDDVTTQDANQCLVCQL